MQFFACHLYYNKETGHNEEHLSIKTKYYGIHTNKKFLHMFFRKILSHHTTAMILKNQNEIVKQ